MNFEKQHNFPGYERRNFIKAMNIKYSIFILLFIQAAFCNGQIMFQKSINQDSYAQNYINKTSDNGYILLSDSNSLDIELIKMDSASNIEWKKSYGSHKIGFSIQQSSDGGYIVGGRSTSSIYLLKIDANGDTLWTRTFRGSNGGFLCNCYKAAQTYDGGYIIATNIYTSATSNDVDIVLIKTNSNGDVVWARAMGRPTTDEQLHAVKQTTDSGYIICGQTQDQAGTDVLIIKTNSFGDTMWVKQYGGDSLDIPNAIQQTGDGGYIICGGTNSFGFNRRNGYLLKLDVNGNIEWSKALGGMNDEEFYDVVVVSDGYVAVGYTGSLVTANCDVLLVKTNKQGAALWSKVFGGSSLDIGHSVIQCPDSGFIISGVTRSFYNTVIPTYIIKTDKNGNSGCNEQNLNLTSMPVTSGTFHPANFVYASASLIRMADNTNINSIVNFDSLLCVSYIGLNEKEQNYSFSVMPNPVFDNLIIKRMNSSTPSYIEILNTLGQVVYQALSSKEEEQVDVSSLNSGIYLVRVSDKNQSWTQKIVKQ